MSESVGRIKDQTSGDWIGTHEGAELEGTLPRMLQTMDLSERHFDSVTTVRGSGTPVVSADPVLFNSFPADLENNLIDVGDKATLVVMPEHTASDGRVWITPIIFNDAEDTILGLRETKLSGISINYRIFDDIVTSRYWSPSLSWDVLGAMKIGLHVTKLYPTNGVVLKAVLL